MEIADEFGQEEKLTFRLNRLLEEYTDGFAVPKELIQNADDAGATEVRFLYDERTNEDSLTCLFDEGMRECQGPALWVYNDAEFREEDFSNITKLNGGTKELRTEKIGKFGLGFNAVYNLTDVPMFVSRNYFVIFDPNTCYLGKAIRNKNKPGIKINTNKNTKRLRNFRNQFKPFNGIFGCDLHLDKEDNSFHGTLFRFPLRTKEQAVKSEIKQVYYDHKHVLELLEIFIGGAKNLLLFTQNVRRVSIFHLPRGSTEQTQPLLLFEVKKSLSPTGIKREVPIPVTLSPAAKNLSKDDQDLLKQCNFLRASSQIAKNAGELNQSGTELLRSAVTINIKSTSTEYGSLFFEGKDHLPSGSDIWFVTSSMGKGQAMQFSERDKSLLPSAGVAVQLIPKENGKFVPTPIVQQTTGQESRHNGTMFCYLPLPIHSGLPIHINGAFAVHSNRRHLKQKTEDDKACIAVEWNNVFLEDSVSAAYLDLLEDVNLASETYPFHLLWPRACDVEPHCEPLARGFYHHIASGNNCLFSDGKSWVDIEQVVFLEPSFRQEDQIGNISFAVLKMLIKGDKVVVDVPAGVVESFEKYGLGKKLYCKLYDKDRFFRELFFPNIASIPSEMRDKLILYVLEDVNRRFDELVKTYPCIPASPDGQTLKCPHQLVNPYKAAASLFRSEDRQFPFGDEKKFLNSLLLAKLEELGMMADDPPWTVFVERAESIVVLNQESNEAALKRTEALIDLLARKLSSGKDISLSEGGLDRLLHAKFLPVATKPNKFPLSWKGDDFICEKDELLLSPKEAFPDSTKYLVCCSEPLVNSFLPFAVEQFLLLDKQATVTHVVTQLDIASSTNVASMKFHEFQEVKTVCLAAYKYLQTALDDKKIGEKHVRRIFEKRKFILTGGEFVGTNHVAFQLEADCSPYLHQLSNDLKTPFLGLMRSAGVKDTFKSDDFISSLEQIMHKFGDTALDTKNLQVAANLTGQLSSCLKDSKEDAENVQQGQEVIYLPDSQGIMRPADDLCMKDCYWLPDEVGVYYVNDMIPPPTSKQLRVKTRREEALQRFTSPFGQKERLTNRLQRILSAFPGEEQILKELLQNADDAGATEIYFIKDPRQHRDKCVFEDSWKPLQGPELCVYNNKPFTEADIEGIQNLGEGSKGDDPNKTGQYGVGFNAVYHLTDVPSFTSSGEDIGDVLCVFDPLCKYVPKADPQEPGRMYRKTKKLKVLFPDVFSCYIEDHFPTQNSTMFRFPLRTREMAKDSKISNTPVTVDALEKMMKAFKGELFEVLLFLNSVKKITLCDIDESGKVVSSYFVEAKMSEEDSAKRQQFAMYVKQTGKSRKQSGDVLPIDAEVRKCSYVLNLRDSNGLEEKWLVVQQMGFENKVEESVIHAYRRHDLGMLPRGGVACPLKSPQKETNQSERKKKAYCFLPLPIETGLPVHINGHFALDHEARRHLWTYKTDDYRSRWNEALVRDVIASCYLALLDEVRNFHQLPVTQGEDEATINCNRRTLLNSVDDYEKDFPPVVSSNPYWAILVMSLYQEMNRKRLRLFPVVRDKTADDSNTSFYLTWLPPTGDGKDKAFFGNIEMAALPRTLDVDAERERTGETSLQQVLLQTGLNLVAFSRSVFTALEKSDVKPCSLSPSAVMEFYKSFGHEDSLCKIRTISVDVNETELKNAQTVEIILDYCKDDKEFLKNLPGLPLLLTQDNYLRTFNTGDPKFVSRHYNILPQCQDMFVHNDISTHIFSHRDSLRASVFKPFDVKSFAANIHRTVPLRYRNCSDGYVNWCPKQKGVPNHDWVRKVWTFLSDEINDVLRELKENEKEKIESIKTSESNFWERSRKIQEAKTSEEEKARIIHATLEPLNDWSILPCTEKIHASKTPEGRPQGLKMRHFLVPLRLAETVLDFHDATSGPLVETLRKVSLPELECTILSRTSSFSHLSEDSCNLARKLVASLKTPTSLLKSFKQKMTRSLQSLEGMLTPTECDTILQYFSDNVSRLLESEKSTLRQLPFYEATYGGLVDVKNQRVCVVPNEFPRDEMHVLENGANVIFLKSKEWLSPLFKFLTFEFPSPADVYCEFVLKYFCLLSRLARLVHLEYIRVLVLYSKPPGAIDKRRRLNDCLADTKIISSNNGVLRKASFFYDPRNEVFATMVSDDKFPPGPFNLPQWLEFLKTIGLIHEVSQDLFKTFAWEVAREGATHPTERTYQKSKVLVAHLFTRDEVVKSGLLEAICSIKFVATDPLSPELLAVCRQFDYTPYTSFEGSVLSKHTKIVWTTATLLPIWANPRKYRGEDSEDGNNCNDILSHLDVAEPTVELVTFHCQNVCFQFGKENFNEVSSEQLSVRTSVMEKIYEFLQAKATSSPTAKKLLKDTSCIVVEQGRRFVKPGQVVIELYQGNQIEPFLYGMPAELGQFMTLFQYLGCSNGVTLNHYSMVLDMLQRKWKENSLDPNERSRALKAVKGLFEALQDNPTGIHGLSSLYLPAMCPFGSSQGESTPRVVLRKAAEILFDDTRHYHKRIQNFDQLFLVDLETAEVRCNSSGNFKGLLVLLPIALRPQMLSCVVEEKFVNPPENPERFDVDAASSLKKQLYSEQFCHGIIRLIRHTSHENEEKVDEGVVSSVESRLKSIRFHGMSKIVTHLVYKENVIPGSESRVPFFF